MIKYFNNKQVNIQVNVNNCSAQGGSGDSQAMYSLLNERIDNMSNKVTTVENNLNDVISGTYFTNKFENYFSTDDYATLLNYIENKDKISGYINGYEAFETYLNSLKNKNSFINYQFKETYVTLVGNPSDPTELKYAIFDNNTVNQVSGLIDDNDNQDLNAETTYKFDISGFVLRTEVFVSGSSDFTEAFLTSMSYDSDRDVTTIFLTSEDFQYIYDLRPRNKLKINYLCKK